MLEQVILLQGEGGLGMMNLVMIAGIFIVMYFFMIRPQTKRQKEQQAFTEAIEKGDRVITAAGIHGKIINMVGTLVTLEISKGVNIKVEKDFISKDLSTRDVATEEA
ncbi:MAG: preprotein translocase subunit YajC [Cognaticolwellia sp.]|jgi:preprotein translocase subunit YajC